MTHMHSFMKFSFNSTKWDIIMIHSKFHNRWLIIWVILHYSKWTDKLSPLLIALLTHFMSHRLWNFERIIIMSYFVEWNANFIKPCMWVITMTHFKYATKSKSSDRYFQHFCIGGCIKFQSRYSDWIKNQISNRRICILDILHL